MVEVIFDILLVVQAGSDSETRIAPTNLIRVVRIVRVLRVMRVIKVLFGLRFRVFLRGGFAEPGKCLQAASC